MQHPRTAFVAATKETLFPSGVGLPGRVWATGKAAWIEDVVARSQLSSRICRTGSRSPWRVRVPDLFRRRSARRDRVFHPTLLSPPDTDLLRTMSTVGNQVGQFMGRKRVETAVMEGNGALAPSWIRALDAIIGMDHQRNRSRSSTPRPSARSGIAGRRARVESWPTCLIPRELRDSHRDGLARYLATGAGTVHRSSRRNDGLPCGRPGVPGGSRDHAECRAMIHRDSPGLCVI